MCLPMSKQLPQGFEVIATTSHHVACDGSGGALGHPRVWLSLDNPEHQVVCGYCSRTYVLSSHAAPSLTEDFAPLSHEALA